MYRIDQGADTFRNGDEWLQYPDKWEQSDVVVAGGVGGQELVEEGELVEKEELVEGEEGGARSRYIYSKSELRIVWAERWGGDWHNRSLVQLEIVMWYMVLGWTE